MGISWERFHAMEKYSVTVGVDAQGLEIVRVTVRVTKKRGVYGYQFAVAIQTNQDQLVSSLTGGCGYDKEAYAFAQIACEVPSWPSTIDGKLLYQYAEGPGIYRTLRKVFPFASWVRA